MIYALLGGSWDLVSKAISTLIGVISTVTLIITLDTKSHDPLSRARTGSLQPLVPSSVASFPTLCLRLPCHVAKAVPAWTGPPP